MLQVKTSAETTPKIYNWLLALATALLMLCVAELTLQRLSPDTYHIWPPGFENQFEPVPGVEGVSVFTINDMGVRGRNFDRKRPKVRE